MCQLKNIQEIVENVCEVKLHTKLRSRKVVDARRIFGSIAIKITKHSLSEIGKFIKKDHTTILHYKKTAEELIETNKRFQINYLLCIHNVPKNNEKQQIIDLYKFHLKKARILARTIKKNNNNENRCNK